METASFQKLMADHYAAIRVAALTACILAAGCTGLQPPQAEEMNVYMLDAAIPAARQEARNSLVLVVDAPRAQPGYDTPRMVYVSRRHEIGFFASNRWVDTPARMLAPLLVQALEKGAGLGTVVQAPTAVAGDLRLETELIRLEQEFITRPSRVRLVLRAQLIAARDRRVLATRQFEETEPAATDDPYGGVLAANRAAQRVLLQVVEFCGNETGKYSVGLGEAATRSVH